MGLETKVEGYVRDDASENAELLGNQNSACAFTFLKSNGVWVFPAVCIVKSKSQDGLPTLVIKSIYEIINSGQIKAVVIWNSCAIS